MSTNIWSGMKDAKTVGSGNYFPSGFKGECKVLRCFANEGGFKKDLAFIAEFEVLTSNMDEVQPGTTRTWYQGKLDDRTVRETALGEVCGFVAAALNQDPKNSDVRQQIEASMPIVVGANNPLKDKTVIVETWSKKTKAGTDFTKHAFRPCS